MGCCGVTGVWGRSMPTLCVWIGMVMMNMMSSTSMTSISGVVFISPIGMSPDGITGDDRRETMKPSCDKMLC